MIKVAITGNIASGKSEVEKMLSEKKYPVFDTDVMAHEILIRYTVEIAELFKPFDILTNAIIDRKKIAQIVFDDKNKLKILEEFIHPKVREEIIKIFTKNNDKQIVFVSVPQLFEAGFENMFDKIIFVSANQDIRTQRLMQRNGLSYKEALKRIEAQLPEEKKKKYCDFIIENNQNVKDLVAQVERLAVTLSIP